MPDISFNIAGIKQGTDELIASITSPEFVAAMQKMKDTPVQDRLALASKTLTPSALANSGVPLPQGMRVTSRYFEPGSPDMIEVDDLGARMADGRAPTMATAAWACACGGTVVGCAGAGGGS